MAVSLCWCFTCCDSPLLVDSTLGDKSLVIKGEEKPPKVKIPPYVEVKVFHTIPESDVCIPCKLSRLY